MSKVVLLNYQNDHDYNLIGIHTTLEDFRLTYFLNKTLNISLERYFEDLDFGANNHSFSIFTYDCEKTFSSWSLISNKYSFATNTKSNTPLFKEEYLTSVLIKERKKIDYFLKIEGDLNFLELEKKVSKINSIKNIITSYSINPQSLKSKDFLIF